MKKRGWTQASVKKLTNNPYTTRKSTNKATGNSATAYYDKKGNYVIVDNRTKEIVQVSNRYDKGWQPDASIIKPYKTKKNKRSVSTEYGYK
ncbi:hypothetical protein MCOL2_08556 [Listeria fleischmannii FSL S10-1203]|uniref:Colicin E5 ribonuclease domain-containing protein n=1 Tax=Listeria fleischmannii FSL S10-1203 TaxID=1265822 RepID=W7DMH2_9LIST|nr:colicin E5-related ribonuclease [Listeria fleischmannii]EUJ57920.1 hypothetical protein MCOL2_08556 [Listeria fleischmannii FSL S10-1203]